MGYLPDDTPNRLVWFTNFKNKLPAQGAALGLSPAEIASAGADAAMFLFLEGTYQPGLGQTLKQVTSYASRVVEGPQGVVTGPPPVVGTFSAPPEVAGGLLPRTRALVKRLKAAPGYTPDIGQDLGIIGSDDASDPNLAKPTFTAQALDAGEVRLKWVKAQFDGVIIEARAPGAASWTPLGTDHFSPFVDTRDNAQPGQPEVREYRMRYLKHDEPIGEWSDVLTVTTKP